MKAITLWQPWASLIALGLKTIETRGHDHFKWLKGQRIAIHAGKQFDRQAIREIASAEWWTPELDERLSWDYDGTRHSRLDSDNVWPSGLVLCTAQVVEARWLTPADNRAAFCRCDPTRFGLVLVQVKRLIPPVPAKGAQGVWEWRRE